MAIHFKLRRFAWMVHLAMISALIAPTVGHAADDTQNLPPDRNNIILNCISEGKSSLECTDRSPYEFEPESLKNYDRWKDSLEKPSLFSWPALTGPSAAELLRQYSRPESNSNFTAIVPGSPSP